MLHCNVFYHFVIKKRRHSSSRCWHGSYFHDLCFNRTILEFRNIPLFFLELLIFSRSHKKWRFTAVTTGYSTVGILKMQDVVSDISGLVRKNPRQATLGYSRYIESSSQETTAPPRAADSLKCHYESTSPSPHRPPRPCVALQTCVARTWDFASKKPFIAAPAMNTCMWDHPMTSRRVLCKKRDRAIVHFRPDSDLR